MRTTELHEELAMETLGNSKSMSQSVTWCLACVHSSSSGGSWEWRRPSKEPARLGRANPAPFIRQRGEFRRSPGQIRNHRAYRHIFSGLCTNA